MRSILLFFFFIALATQSTAQDRLNRTINGDWKFIRLDPEGASSTDFDDSLWETVSLPHTWNDRDVLDETPGYYRGPGWYRKSIRVPQLYTGQKVFLYFEGANQVTMVFVNGEQAGPAHLGGYTSFAVNITDHLRADAQQVLAIRVDNTYRHDLIPLEGDFNFYGGIYRDVYLLITPEVHLDVLDHGSTGVYLSTPSVSSRSANVRIRARLVNESDADQPLRVRNILFDAAWKEVASGSRNVSLAAGSLLSVEAELSLADPHLWSPFDPYLYTLRTEVLRKDGSLLDKVDNPLGFRWFRFDADSGFFLNGQYLKLIGTNRHQDYAGSGNALRDETHRRDMEMLKEMGINFLRISHYPQDPAVLEMCDRLGFVVTEEIPFVNRLDTSQAFRSHAGQMLREMIRRDFNHPCIVAWGNGNETTMRLPPEREENRTYRETYITALRELHMYLSRLAREEDPARDSYQVLHQDISRNVSLGLHTADLIGYNRYFGWYDGGLENIGEFLDQDLSEMRRSDPGRPFILSEYGAGADPRLHSLQPTVFDFSVEYQLALHKKYLRYILDHPQITGSNVWNFADFMAEPRVDAVPHVNNKGLVSLDRRPKDSYYFYQVALSNDPALVIPSRLWTLRSGRADGPRTYSCTQPVEVFGNTGEAELWLNGVSLGRKDFDFFSATWEVPFRNGKNILEVRTTGDEPPLSDHLEIEFRLEPWSLDDPAIPFRDIAVNAGSRCYLQEEGPGDVLWVPDQEYRPGSWGYTGGHLLTRSDREIIGSNQDILGTNLDPVYQTQRLGMDSYRFDVPDGDYEVELCFSELLSGSLLRDYLQKRKESQQDTDGENIFPRIFSLSLNGKVVIPALNLQESCGVNRAWSERFFAEARKGSGLLIQFTPLSGEAVVNGIKVRKIR